MHPNMDLYWGRNYPWLAVDAYGAIGHFLSGGTGHIPNSILECPEPNDAAVEYFYNKQRRVTDPVLNGSTFGFIDMPLEMLFKEHQEYSKKGAYSFELRDSPRDYAYVKMTSPVTPIRVDAFPSHLRDFLKNVRFGFHFAEIDVVDMNDIDVL